MLKKIINKRRIVQALFAIAIYAAISRGYLPLLYVIAGGATLGLIFGKVFCRWMCPVGFIIELMFKLRGNDAQRMYNYHKLGCPIAWVSGLLNRSSLFTIEHDAKSCIDCGICDKTCYITSLNENYSLFKFGKKSPVDAFSCSRCLDCVAACPKGSLSYRLEL